MNIKKFILGILLVTFITLPVNADLVWPSLYIAKGMLSIKVILLGLIIELFFVKYFTKVSWKKASIVTFLMNYYNCTWDDIYSPVRVRIGICFCFCFLFL